MAAGDPYQVRVTGIYLGQSVENVFWFYQNITGSAPNPIAGLISWLKTNFFDDIVTVQNDGFTWDTIAVQNWQNVTQSGSDSIATYVGEVAGTPMPSWLTYTVSFNRLGAGYNYPMKRIAGVDETLTLGNSVSSTTIADIISIFEDMILFTTATGANFSYMAYGNPPALGAADQLNAVYRPQFPTEVRGVILGTQKTRKP